MRSLNYVQRVSLDFTGTLFPHAICLGDADNDTENFDRTGQTVRSGQNAVPTIFDFPDHLLKFNELVVGDTGGKLHVYKNDDSKAWITRSCVGMLTCVAVGDVCNKGKNFVVAVGAEGWFHLFDLTASKADSSSQHDALSADEQKPCFTQHIPANTKVILISDIDGDGRSELVVGYTDRVVRAFRWEEPSDGSDVGSGQLVLLKKWLLEGQVDSLSVNPGPEGLPELMVSQPGCGYAILQCSWTQQDSPHSGGGDEDDAPATPGSEGPSRDVVLHLTTGRIHNKNVSTHLIGSISKGSKEESSKCGLFALCTLDGTLKLMDSSEQLLWSVQVDHQLFALQKLDVTRDGREEVVACAWDGQTYIIDHNRTVVRFQFDENVNAFCAGQYTCKEGKNSPCLVYVSFNHKIYIYWKVELERMESTSLLRVLDQRPEFKGHLQTLGMGGADPAGVRALLEDVLYADASPL
ncbi:KICSTOR complex protein ITFG2 isoform X2 [Dunckerocampus dactyliophorus]|uniref:KICSTOR complex protein ITFG2 isoform X2 n=1 Tax=Dunckerocampus dactyliophorus TaxID=161453 RepID=UPI002406AD70|nr:KICSTOR complex protein ITFG2 isoform X2 [Dunckerocampus dactyliophorus]